MLKKYFVLYASFLVVIFHHFIGYSGHFGFDDMHYAKLAKFFLDGYLDFSDHFTHRWTIIFTTALSYEIFGISDFSSSLGAMLCAILTLYLTFLMIKDRPIYIIALVLSLIVTNSWLLFYSDKLMPDLYIVLSFTIALASLYFHRFVYAGRKSFLLSAVFTLSIFFGFFTKGTIILFLPLFLIICISDLLKKRFLNFWIFSAILGIALITIYFIVMHKITGDAFYRFSAIKENSYLNACSYFSMPVKYLLERITYGLFNMFISHDLILFFVFLIPATFQFRVTQLFSFDNQETFFVSSSMILLFLANFMSISLTSYNPMCIDPRHYLYIVPVASIASAKVFNSTFIEQNTKTSWFITLLAISICAISITSNHKVAYWRYLPLTILLILIQLAQLSFFNRLQKFKNLGYWLFVTILLIYTLEQTFDPYKENYKQQKLIIKEFIKSKSNDAKIAILTNNVQKRFGDYYLGFDSAQNMVFLEYSSDSIVFQNEFSEVFILHNPYTRYLSFQTFENFPWYSIFAGELFEPVIKKGEIIFYNANILKSNFGVKHIITSFHDFEQNSVLWVNKPELLSDKEYYSEAHSSKLPAGGFSPTFSIKTDTLKHFTPETARILINTSVYCLVNEETPAVLVVSLEEKGMKPYYWQASNINHFAKVFDNWEKAKLTRFLPNEIKDGSILNIYVWNNGKKDLFIDDFAIEIGYLVQ